MTATQRSSRGAVQLRRVARTGYVTAQIVRFLASPSSRDDPRRAYARIRRLDPVHRSPLGVFVVTSHAEVNQVLRDHTFSSNEDNIDLSRLRLGPLRWILGRGNESVEQGPYFEQDLLLFLDPPDHTRLRRLVSRSFTPRRVAELEERIADIADELLAPVIQRGQAELMHEFAYPFPARVICELIGVPRADAHHIIDNAPALAAGLDPGPMLSADAARAANDATVAVTAYIDDLIERRLADPGDDLLSALLHEGDERLTNDELVTMVVLLLMAGHETTANLLGNAIVALLEQPAALAELRADPNLDAAAVDELLRFDSPVQLTMRIATQQTDLGAHTVEPGSAVVLATGAANHDEAVYPHPDRLDWHRTENPHLAFGSGIHYCLGASLARAEARIGLRHLLDQLGDFYIDGSPTRRPSFTVRGLSELPIRWKTNPRSMTPFGGNQPIPPGR